MRNYSAQFFVGPNMSVVANEDLSVDLGGFFYDQLLGGAGEVVGVRYWLDVDEGESSQSSILKQIDDDRLRVGLGYVDIFFNQIYDDASVPTTQEFGRDSAILNGDFVEVSFELEELE